MLVCEESGNCHNTLIDHFQCLTFNPENVLEKILFYQKIKIFCQTQKQRFVTFLSFRHKFLIKLQPLIKEQIFWQKPIDVSIEVLSKTQTILTRGSSEHDN